MKKHKNFENELHNLKNCLRVSRQGKSTLQFCNRVAHSIDGKNSRYNSEDDKEAEKVESKADLCSL